MKNKTVLTELMMVFFVSTACICILMGTVSVLLTPDNKVGYAAFLAPPILGFFSALFSLIMYSGEKLSVKQIIIRRAIHLILIEAAVWGFNYINGIIFDTQKILIMVVSVFLVYMAVSAVIWLNDRRSAAFFNDKLREFQQRENSG